MPGNWPSSIAPVQPTFLLKTFRYLGQIDAGQQLPGDGSLAVRDAEDHVHATDPIILARIRISLLVSSANGHRPVEALEGRQVDRVSDDSFNAHAVCPFVVSRMLSARRYR